LKGFKMTAEATKGNFDFTAINNATKGLPAGMLLAIAQGFVTRATNTMNKFENACEEQAIQLGADLQALREAYKATKPE
jgi:hypothetical protein